MGDGRVFGRTAPVSRAHSKFLRNGEALGALEQPAKLRHLVGGGK